MNTKVKLLALFMAAAICMGSCQLRAEPEVIQEAEEVEVDEPIEEVLVVETPEPTPEIIETHEPARDWTIEAEHLAKTVYGEARGCNKTEQAGVIWCVLNRVDSESALFPNDIVGVVTQYQQFHGYSEEHPVLDELLELALDVIDRWQREKDGEEDVGRVLPAEYLWFHGDGRHNHFRNKYENGTRWSWSLPSPYES